MGEDGEESSKNEIIKTEKIFKKGPGEEIAGHNLQNGKKAESRNETQGG